MFEQQSAELATRFQQVRQRTQELCAPLETEDFVPQAVEFASPPKWHLAHTTWFFEEMVLCKFLPDYRVFHPSFSQLFNSYYQSVGTLFDRNRRGVITRPTVKQVFAYRKYVDEQMLKLLETKTDPELLNLIELGINHEQQHQELLVTDLKLVLGLNPTFPIYDANYIEGHDISSQGQQWLEIAAGNYSIGATGDSFCFDNERQRHTVYLNDFSISSTLVTNEAYGEFIHAGGYADFSLWLDEGWTWLAQQKISAPMYWVKQEDQWVHFTLDGLQPLSPRAPVTHISFYEASAFASWAGYRLPTEFEWEVCADQIAWGQRWEWTSSAYLPYPGFAIGEGAVGEYNGKFMTNQMVLRGASVATAAQHSRATYRNFFHPHQQWQYSGIRLAK